MKDSKKIQYNLIVGLVGQLITIILGIVIPKLVLNNFGSEVNGLLSSVTNIYAYIAIVEAGISAASCQALYGPLANDDKGRANAVLSAANQYYHRSGLMYCALIVLFAMVYPMLIRSEIPYLTIVLVILFNGIGNVVNYFFHGKYLVLLKADGKRFVESGILTVTNFLKQFSKILLIALGYSVIMVQMAAMLVSFVQMIYITVYVHKYYPWVDLHTAPDKSAISQSRNVLVHEINYLITANVDVVLLTAFATLKHVSVYSLYALLFSMVNRCLRIIRDAFEFKIARFFHGKQDLFSQVFQVFEICYIMLAFSAFSITNFFILPFLRIYTSGVTDAVYIDTLLPLLFVAINLLSAGRYPSDALIHIAGHFKLTQRSATIESAINIITSLVLVRMYGIAGVLAGTIVSSVYRMNYLIIYVNKKILMRNPAKTYICWGINFLVYLFILMASSFLNLNLTSYLNIIVCCIPYSVFVVAVYSCVTLICYPDVRGFLKAFIKRSRSM